MQEHREVLPPRVEPAPATVTAPRLVAWMAYGRTTAAAKLLPTVYRPGLAREPRAA